ncbi:hypothetical protein F6W70_13755 [Microbacterium maritypicum]|uniref:SseB protein N-terminal domain-containing protein n=1 Tax=Microbacterium maritypicum TaxID=33918 RepID=A0AAD3X1H3_MICMQ|nr:hypothetical protein [Microbacterium liquefaciens]KAB1883657.1 hypothetical protein F6W70_13755 [Microbacterium liquefaciens]
MTDESTMEPFEPYIGTAKMDAEKRLDDLRARREREPDGWLALQLAEYWNGFSTVAVFKPDEVEGRDFAVAIAGRPQQFAAGPGLVAVLLDKPTLAVEVYADGVRTPLELVRL